MALRMVYRRIATGRGVEDAQLSLVARAIDSELHRFATTPDGVLVEKGTDAVSDVTAILHPIGRRERRMVKDGVTELLASGLLVREEDGRLIMPFFAELQTWRSNDAERKARQRRRSR